MLQSPVDEPLFDHVAKLDDLFLAASLKTHRAREVHEFVISASNDGCNGRSTFVRTRAGMGDIGTQYDALGGPVRKVELAFATPETSIVWRVCVKGKGRRVEWWNGVLTSGLPELPAGGSDCYRSSSG